MKQIVMGLVFLFWMFSSGFADDGVYVKSGSKYYRLYKAADGTPQTVEILMVDLDGGQFPQPPPKPDDPIPPVPPPTGDTVRNFVRDLARQSDQKAVAKALSLIYGDCYSKLVAGEMTAEDAQSWIKFTYTYAISTYGGDQAFWTGLVAKIGEQSTKLRQEGGLKTDAQWATFYKSVSAGLDDVAAGAAFDFEKFFDLLKKLFDLWILIKTFGVF
jgi:hypothetical protein